MMITKTKCAGRKFKFPYECPCDHYGTLPHDGRMWCAKHHPPTINAKREEKHRKWLLGYDAKVAQRERDDADTRERDRKAACFDEMLSALKAALPFLPSHTRAVDQVVIAIARAEEVK